MAPFIVTLRLASGPVKVEVGVSDSVEVVTVPS
jgi:hypothetical protein